MGPCLVLGGAGFIGSHLAEALAQEGHRVKVYLSNDLLLPAYEKHQMPSDL